MSSTLQRDRDSASRAFVALEIVLIFVAMWIHAGWLTPDVNEPNYLGKAKHFWQPEWCEGDFFLDTADAHHAFYWTFGWLTQWMSLAAVALLGRAVTYALLAVAWWRLSWAIVPRRMFAVLSAMILLTCAGRLHMAGEWFAGGFEAKGLAYAFVWFGLAALVSGRWRAVWPLLGVASALHIVVGGWAILAAGLAWWSTSREEETPSFKAMLPSLALGFLLSSPAWIGMLLLNQGATGDQIAEAAEIQVFGRLPHHLDPARLFSLRGEFPFLSLFAWRHLSLVAIWAVLSFGVVVDAPLRRLRMFVLGVVLFAVMGVVVRVVCSHWLLDYPTISAQLLRLYWFRMTDSIVPLGTALAAVAIVARVQLTRPVLAKATSVVLVAVGLTYLSSRAVRWVEFPYPPADTKIVKRTVRVETNRRYRDWLALCDRVRSESAHGSLFLTPPHNQTFKWYAERGEVVTWKEMPQDARSVVAWWERFHDVCRRDRKQTVPLAYLDAARIRELGEKYGADYAVADAEPRVDLPEWYRNASFVVYRLSGDGE